MTLCRAAVCLIAIIPILGAQPACPSRDELRRILANRDEWHANSRRDSIFYCESQLRPALRSSLQDGETRERAQWMLALIGDPEDLRLVIRIAPAPRPGPFSNRWAYGVAVALLEPTTEQEWAFLGQCALNSLNDRWVDAGAIQSLKLIASPRSLQILNETLQQNTGRERSAARAIAYIQSNPLPLRDENLNQLADRVANVIRIGKLEEERRVRYNEGGDKALVDWAYNTGEDRLTYTGTFHKVDGVWRLRGVRETLQEMIGSATVVINRPPVKGLPSPPELAPVPATPPVALDQILPPMQPPNPTNPKKN
jgi:hypothetical protein